MKFSIFGLFIGFFDTKCPQKNGVNFCFVRKFLMQKDEQEMQSGLSDEEFDRKLAEMLREQEERKRRRRERDFEM